MPLLITPRITNSPGSITPVFQGHVAVALLVDATGDLPFHLIMLISPHLTLMIRPLWHSLLPFAMRCLCSARTWNAPVVSSSPNRADGQKEQAQRQHGQTGRRGCIRNATLGTIRSYCLHLPTYLLLGSPPTTNLRRTLITYCLMGMDMDRQSPLVLCTRMETALVANLVLWPACLPPGRGQPILANLTGHFGRP